MRIVLDANVVISTLIWGGTPYKLIEAAVEGDVVLCTSPALLDELRTVLAREHLAVRLERQQSSVEETVTLYAALSVTEFPIEALPVVPGDPDDDQVIAAAVAAAADLVVSGDRQLLAVGKHAGFRIVTPTEAVTTIAK